MAENKTDMLTQSEVISDFLRIRANLAKDIQVIDLDSCLEGIRDVGDRTSASSKITTYDTATAIATARTTTMALGRQGGSRTSMDGQCKAMHKTVVIVTTGFRMRSAGK